MTESDERGTMASEYELDRDLPLSRVRKAIWWGPRERYRNETDAWLRNKFAEIHDLGYDFPLNLDMKYWRERTAERWREFDPQSEQEIFEFYRTHEPYIPELMLWTYEGQKIQTMRSYYEWFVDSDVRCERVLDYGGGVGDVSLFLNIFADAYYCDVGGVLTEFYQQRMDARSMEYPDPVIVDDPDWRVSDELDDLDVIVTNDVIEHVPQPESVVAGMVDALRPGGYLATQWTFADAENTPCHINTSDERASATLDVLRDRCTEVHSTWNSFIRLWQKDESA